MEKLLASYTQQAYAAMRIIIGLVFFCHGLQKVFGLFGGVNGAAAPLLSLFGIAGLIELIAGALITIGWCTVVASFRQRRDGGGVLHRPFSQGFLADSKWRRTSGSFMFCFSLYGDAQRGHMERRRRIEVNR